MTRFARKILAISLALAALATWIPTASADELSQPEPQVTPVISVSALEKPQPLIPFSIKVNVTPATFSGKTLITVSNSSGKDSWPIYVNNGVGEGKIKTNGAGTFKVSAQTESTPAFTEAQTEKPLTVHVKGRTLRLGARGKDVSALMRRLSDLGFLLPQDGSLYTKSASEVTMAFQKTYHLPRTYVWGSREWAKLSTLRFGPQAQVKEPGLHVEVYKGRQIMFVVNNGVVIAIAHVSTGATGNTPVGTFHIFRRGGSPLYKFQYFIGNFGLHGYFDIPPHPASHGCVREPNWVALWVWNHTRIGTKVIVYR